MCKHENESFGEFFKRKRIESGTALREFCRKHGLDPGNISRLERGRAQSPRNRVMLRMYAEYLSLNSQEWELFCDLADISNNRMPRELTEGEFAKYLPVLFGVGRGEVNEEKLREFVNRLSQLY